jgi:deaminated glutathione amidase
MTFRAACIQLTSSNLPEENIATADRLVRAAAKDGATYIQTPEMTNIVERDRESLASRIRPETSDPSIAAFSKLAAELGIVLHVGSLALAEPEGRIANRAFVFGPDGRTIARYDKIHLYDVDLPNGESWRESAVYHPGDRAVIAETPFARLGITICYDLRFPQLFRTLSHAGATVLTAPAAFTRLTGEAHWQVLQRARAIENGAFMISAAQAGTHADGRETYGHSIIVAPWGEVLAEGGPDGEEIVAADIDVARSIEVRQRIPVLKNERRFQGPDIPGVVPLRSVS